MQTLMMQRLDERKGKTYSYANLYYFSLEEIEDS